MECTRAWVEDGDTSGSKSSNGYILIWKSGVFCFDLEALTALDNPHRALGVARKPPYTRVPGNLTDIALEQIRDH